MEHWISKNMFELDGRQLSEIFQTKNNLFLSSKTSLLSCMESIRYCHVSHEKDESFPIISNNRFLCDLPRQLVGPNPLK